jgi:hypothetical protein
VNTGGSTLAGVRTTARAAACLLVLVALDACRRSSGVLAVVGGRPLRLDAVSAAIAAEAGKPIEEVSPDLAAALFERMLEEEVILASSSDPSDRNLTGPARSARLREISASLCPPPPPPSEADVHAYIAAHAELQHTGERLLLRQLILPDQTGAAAARERIRRGEDFAALSRELSRAPNAATGGALGWVERGQLPPEFEAAVFSLPKGGVSVPVSSSAGWHVFQVVDRRTGGEPDASALASARAVLGAETADTAWRTCLAAVAARVGVEVRADDTAPFPCRNPFEEKP